MSSLLGGSEVIATFKPEQYTRTYEFTRLPSGRMVFRRAPKPKAHGDILLPDEAQVDQLWGSVDKLPDNYDGWLREGDWCLIKPSAICLPVDPSEQRLFCHVSDILMRTKNINGALHVELLPGYILLNMEPDITHHKGIELPDTLKRMSRVGFVHTIGETSLEVREGQRVVIHGDAGIWLFDDIAGVPIEGRWNLIHEDSIVCLVEDF